MIQLLFFCLKKYYIFGNINTLKNLFYYEIVKPIIPNGNFSVF